MSLIEKAIIRISGEFNVEDVAVKHEEEYRGVLNTLKRVDKKYPLISSLVMTVSCIFGVFTGWVYSKIFFGSNIPPDRMVFLVVAVVGGLVTYLTSVSSRDHEIAKLRCEWLEKLKDEVSNFTGNLSDALFYLISGSNLDRKGEEEDLTEVMANKASSQEFKECAREVIKS